jgi:hypothetical protein
MATTYAAYHNLWASPNSSRQASVTSDIYTSNDNNNSSSTSKTKKLMAFLAPRIPLHEPLTPTSVLKRQQQELENQKRMSVSSSSGKPSMSDSVDRVYGVHLAGTEYFGMDEKK